MTKTMEQIKDWAVQEALVQLKKSGDVAYKQALRFFLNTLAYDTATYLATGDKGQMPMFETEGWGGYLKNTADNTAGAFIESLGKNMSTLKFNLCSPDPSVLIKINLGLQRTYRPKKPSCTFSDLTKNWEAALKDKDFLNKFQDMFNPWSNDLGIALTLQTGMETEVSKKVDEAVKDRTEGLGIKPVKDPVSGKIKTPVTVVREFFYKPVQDSTSAEKVYTGSIVADSIDVFLNTLAGRLMDKWLKKGLVTDFANAPNKLDSLTDPNAQKQNEGVTGAEKRNKSLIEPNFKVRGDYDILNELATCPNPNKAGPTNCVIDEKFRQAIEKRLTVGQAMEQGYLNGNGVFGFSSDGLEPRYNEGYPYRSMLILRKFRILPMGWEVAAQKIKDRQQTEVRGTKNLNDLVNCTESWCAGLVDPNWVLMAPQNFCKNEGAGPEILSEQVAGQGSASSLAVLRNDKYCADEQSCIKEKTDGSCQLYGYCTEERRKWDFNAKSCEARNNTCQTFSLPAGQTGSADNQTISYLKNTLDYGTCNAGNSGCQKYAIEGSYDTASKSVRWDGAGDSIYLNGNTQTCDAADQGCHEFIRLNPGGGANLLLNSGFEQDLAVGGWSGFGQSSDTAFQGARSLKMNGAKNKQVSAGGNDYNIAGETYTLSFYAKDCSIGDKFSLEDMSAGLNQGGDWTRYNLSYAYPADAATNKINFAVNSSSCLIDNIKLESGGAATNYGDYGQTGLIYEKVLPGYLNSSCYDANGNPKIGAPAECDNFARRCKASEAGCELYTSTADGSKIPAKASAQDYCPAECSGYNSFVQNETAFDSAREAYFIPKTAKICGAEAVGCDQFTNLDEVAKGGEGIEYYTYLRQCVKKADNAASCGEFYTWEGSDESGYQLKVESLKTSGSGVSQEPNLTQNDSFLCSQAIYNLPATDPAYNPDCRQFYNRAGGVSYHLYSRTVSCTDDCHPYRRTELNVDESITSSGACVGTDKHWDANSDQCQVCKNGGVWSAGNNACIYQAVPKQGLTCSAAQNGCREYSGNTGNNVRNIFTDDFSDGTVGAWSGANGGTVAPSNEAIILGPGNKGNSIKITTAAKRPVSNSVSQGKSYVLNFTAKAVASADLSMSLANGAGAKADFAKISLTADWQIYHANLGDLNHPVAADEFLLLSAGQSFYIDSITLTEVTDRYYLIKNSWRTPASCDQDQTGAPHELYMLGCSEYSDRAGKISYLKQFSQLCSDSAVGCELMIDTQNSSDPAAETFNASDPASKITVPADNFSYVVYDQSKLCGAEQKGCQRLGKSYKYENATLYGDAYLKNNPDKYNQILCGADSAGCKAFAYDGGEMYFKDPGDQVCEWRQPAGQGETWGWYKKKVKRCSGAGAVCLSDADCSAGVKCQTETADNSCPTSEYKTLGLGGTGNQVSQPSSAAGVNWAGVCSAADSGCGEYIDPVSKFNTNIIFNGGFQTLATSPSDGWSASAGGFAQDVTLDPNTVYRLGRLSAAGKLTISGCTPANSIYLIDENNKLIGPKSSIEVPDVNYDSSRIFYYKSNDKANCKITAENTAGAVELKKAAVDYQLSQNLDMQSCNGIVNFDKGCVLFNQRKQDGASPAKLNLDADTTAPGAAPSGGAGVAGADKDSNIIIKAAPDRTCDKWLACRSYIKDENGRNVCFDVGLCDAVDDNGNCKSFINSRKENQLADGPSGLGADGISNLSGYAKVGIVSGSLAGDYYPFGAMSQIGEVVNISNSGFEFYGSNLYPIGWTWSGQEAANKSWDTNVFSVINNPISAQTEGIGYAPEGASFLKLGSSFDATSEYVDVIPNTDYVITAYVNTKNLKSGQAVIDIIGNTASKQNIAQNIGNDWQFKIGKFRTAAGGTKIKVKLYSTNTGTAEGNYYFDDIKIRPALNAKNNWYTPQTCRLYPQTDSLSCDYYQDSGKHQKGWYGYCLEYDRPPGDPKACILWYPIDKVKGEGVEEGAGYLGKVPVYYCLDAKPFCNGNKPQIYCDKVVETVSSTGQSKYWSSRVYQGSDYQVPMANDSAGRYIDWGTNGGGREDIVLKYTRTSPPFGSVSPPRNSINNPYDWDGVANTDVNTKKQPLMIYNSKTSTEQINGGTPYALTSSTGITCPGSSYESGWMCSGAGSGSWSKELGTWDSCAVTRCYPGGCQCSFSKNTNGVITASCTDNTGNDDCDSVTITCQNELSSNLNQSLDVARNETMRIFGQSYGAWQWQGTADDGRYETAANMDWAVPNTICPGVSRPAYPSDYCAVLPSVFNIKVNSSAANVELYKNGFVNLTFNTKIDSNQLPLVMYAVDWGDNEKTTVTGVEMRDRPNPDNPHSLYHLYSYWDLKAKANSGIAGIDCSAPGQCRIQVKVRVKDNWGWCNGGTAVNDCDQWQNFSGTIVVNEK